MLTFRPETMPEVTERSKSFRSEQVRVAPLVTASVLLEYMDSGISKSAALAKELELHGWNPENLLAFGDQDNDADMLAYAGVGVCMGNGSEKSKKAANFVTAGNDHAGIAEFLNKYILNKTA